DHELPARVRRLERRLTRQRGAYVPRGRLGAVRARSPDPRPHVRRRQTAAAALWAIFQLLHRWSVRSERSAAAGHGQSRGRLRAVTAVRTPRYPQRCLGLFANGGSTDGRRTASDLAGVAEGGPAVPERRTLEWQTARERSVGQGLDDAACADRRHDQLRVP